MKYIIAGIVGWFCIQFTIFIVFQDERLESWDYCKKNGWCD